MAIHNIKNLIEFTNKILINGDIHEILSYTRYVNTFLKHVLKDEELKTINRMLNYEEKDN